MLWFANNPSGYVPIFWIAVEVYQLWHRRARAGWRKAGSSDFASRKVAVAIANTTARAASYAVGLDTLNGINPREDCAQHALMVDYRQLAYISSVSISTDDQITRRAAKRAAGMRTVVAAMSRMPCVETSHTVEFSHRHVGLDKPAGRTWQCFEIGINFVRSAGGAVGIPDLDARVVAIDARDSSFPGIAQTVFYTVDDVWVPASNRNHRDKQVFRAHRLRELPVALAHSRIISKVTR